MQPSIPFGKVKFFYRNFIMAIQAKSIEPAVNTDSGVSQEPTAKITVIKADNGNQNKTLSIKDGNLHKQSNAQLSSGWAEVMPLTLAELSDFISNILPNQVLSLGKPHLNGKPMKSIGVVREAELGENPSIEAVARNKEHFKFKAGYPAFMLFDIDRRLDNAGLTREEVWEQLCDIDPHLHDAGYIAIPSSSSFIYGRDGTEYTGVGGWHFYLMVNDAALIPDYGKNFGIRAWLSGYGYILNSATGSQLVRNLVDTAVFSPERLIFEAKPTLKSGLVDRKPENHIQHGGVLDLSALTVTDRDLKNYEKLVAQAKAKNEPTSFVIKQLYVAQEAENIVAKNPTVPIEEAKAQLEQSLSTGKLVGHQILIFDDGTEVTVNDVLAAPKKYHLKTLHDPFEPDQGRNRAKIYVNDNGSVVVHSQLHGGRSYVLSKATELKQSNKVIDNSNNQLIATSKTNIFPYYRVHYDSFDGNPSGVYLYDKQDDDVKKIRISAPLEIVAIEADQNGGHFGRRLKIKNTLGDSTELSIPMAMLEKPSELLSELRNRGLDFDSTKKAKDAVIAYINSVTPQTSYEITLNLGWYKNSFILPHQTIGEQGYRFKAPEGEPLMNPYSEAGDLEQWKQNVARLASGNPIVIMAISVAFAGALLKKLGMPGLGVHIFGNSSTGKSTTLIAASSVFGKPTDFKRSWKATGNGLEGAAVMYNDSMLALDEIGESDPKELDDSIYRLINGVGKLRANIKGKFQQINTWATAVLSNGEHSVAVHMMDAGKRIKAGVAVRMINVPVFGEYGIFDDLHGYEHSGDFANHFKQVAMTYFGTAGIEWLKQLIDDKDIADLQEHLKVVKELIVEEGGFDNLNPQEDRVINSLATIALAGEMATDYGITGWEIGEVKSAIVAVFGHWKDSNNSPSIEHTAVLDAVRAFIEQYGQSRFIPLLNGEADSDYRVNNSAGYVTDYRGKKSYLFHKAGMREVLAHYEFELSVAILIKEGWLLRDSNGDNVQHKTSDGRKRLYTIQLPEAE